MPIEDMLEKLHKDEVAWDEVRERRVFNRIRQELDEPQRKVSFLRPVALGAVAGVFVLLIVGFVVFRVINDSPQSNMSGQQVVATADSVSNDDSSIMAIPGVGQVKLQSGARVAVWQRTSEKVKLQQTEGQAIYDIEHRSGRQVFVYANGVEIRVVGTVFTVTVQEERVNVDVSRGIVRINDGTRIVELRAGEAISVAPHGDVEDDENQETPDIEVTDEQEIASDSTMEFDVEDTIAWRRAGRAMDKKAQPRKRGAQQSNISSVTRKSTKELFNEVDQARKSGDFSSAGIILEEIISRKDDRSSVGSALFILGKVERAKGRHVRAAQVFSRCHRLVPGGPLAEDALAEEADSWSRARKTDEAKQAAEQYKKRYPTGIHAERMNRILE